MSDFKTELDGFCKDFFQNETIKTYLNLKEEIKNNKELNKLQKDITKYAQLMTKNVDNDPAYFVYKEKYEFAKSKYDQHPLVHNLKEIAPEVESMLWQLKEILE